MKRLVVFVVLLVSAAACNQTEEPPPTTASPLSVGAGELETAALGKADAGKGWTEEKDAAPSTIQIGGEVGAANVKGAEQEATSAFKQEAGAGYVTNSLFLVESASLAEAVIAAHRQATEEKWTQERKDGGGTQFRRTGEVSGLPGLGDEMFTAKVNATVRTAGGVEAKRKIEYVVYRIDRLLAFVIAQDVGVSKYARAQEQNVAKLAG